MNAEKLKELSIAELYALKMFADSEENICHELEINAGAAENWSRIQDFANEEIITRVAAIFEIERKLLI